MAFKTDQLKLKETYANENQAGTPANGTLALIGSTGSKVLKVRDNGNWANVVGAGATSLVGLGDVPVAPAGSDEHKVCVINGSGQMVFEFIDGANITDGLEYHNSHTIHTAAWSGDVTMADGATIQNAVFYNLTSMNPSSTQYYLKVPPAASFGTLAKLEIINGSDQQMILKRETDSGGSADPQFWWRASNSGSQVATIEIGSGQRAMFLKTNGNPHWEVVVLSL